jgi:hypothetical protein
MENTQPPTEKKSNSKVIIFAVIGIGILCLICVVTIVGFGLFALPGLDGLVEPATATPYPTYTPVPPTPVPPTASQPEPETNPSDSSQQEGNDCVFWKDITRAMEGEKHCVYGEVYKTYNTNEAWRIDFGSEKNSFFMYDTKYYYNVVVGDCVMAEGTIKLISGVPYLNIENQKLYYCE